jgi:ankyrin repeat protein
VNIKNGFDESPMDIAVHAKLQNIVNLLIEHGAETSSLKDTEKTTEESKKPLASIWKGATEGNIEIVKQHLDAGVDINAKNSDGESPLQLAAQVGQKEILELLISKGADINTKDVVGWTPVIEAAREGHKEIVELLISKGANLNARDRLIGATTLHYAAVNGHKEIVKILIKNAADFNSKDMAGQTPLNFAIDEGMDEIADLLRKHGGKTGKELKADSGKTGDEIKTPTISIWKDAEKGDIEAVKLHLDNGVDVNAKDNIGWTPLHFATVLDHKEIVELLIATGADVNAKNKEGRTPLNWASGETADLLRKHGGKTGAELKAEGK